MLIVLFPVILSIVGATPCSLWVSSFGNDTNSGTSTSPLRTISAAYSSIPVSTECTILVYPDGVYGPDNFMFLRGVHVTIASAKPDASGAPNVVLTCAHRFKEAFLFSSNDTAQLQWSLSLHDLAFENCPLGAVWIDNYPNVTYPTSTLEITNCEFRNSSVMIHQGGTVAQLQGFNATLQNVHFSRGSPLCSSLVLRQFMQATLVNVTFQNVKSGPQLIHGEQLVWTDSAVRSCNTSLPSLITTMYINDVFLKNIVVADNHNVGMIWDSGIGQKSSNGAVFTVTDLLFEGNTGLMIFQLGSYTRSVVTDTTMRRNQAMAQGFGMGFMENVDIVGFVMDDFKVFLGSCVEIDSSQSVGFRHSHISGCDASESVVTLRGSAATFRDTLIERNNVTKGGAVNSMVGSMFTGLNCTFANNRAKVGGAFFVDGGWTQPSSVMLLGGTVRDNFAMNGAVVFCDDNQTQFSQQGTQIVNNTSLDHVQIECKQ